MAKKKMAKEQEKMMLQLYLVLEIVQFLCFVPMMLWFAADCNLRAFPAWFTTVFKLCLPLVAIGFITGLLGFFQAKKTSSRSSNARIASFVKRLSIANIVVGVIGAMVWMVALSLAG